jgi:Rod binding domain-containing protein
VKSKEYCDRNQAYAVLVNKCQEVACGAIKDTVAKKINSFRSVFHKELLKVMKSAHSGAGADNLYKPSLW